MPRSKPTANPTGNTPTPRPVDAASDEMVKVHGVLYSPLKLVALKAHALTGSEIVALQVFVNTLRTERDELRAALESAMSWIDNWDPQSPASDDSGEWDEFKEKVDKMLSDTALRSADGGLFVDLLRTLPGTQDAGKEGS